MRYPKYDEAIVDRILDVPQEAVEAEGAVGNLHILEGAGMDILLVVPYTAVDAEEGAVVEEALPFLAEHMGYCTGFETGAETELMVEKSVTSFWFSEHFRVEP